MSGIGTTWLDAFSGPVAESLLRASLEGAVVIALVALLVRAVPRLPTAVRCGLWWAACLKLVLALAWWSPLELPVLPAALAPAPAVAERASERETTTEAAAPARDPLATAAPVAAAPLPTASAPTTPVPAARPAAPRSWRALAVAAVAALWWLGVLAGGVATLREASRLRGVLRRAAPVEGGPLLARLHRLCERLGLRPPRLLVCHEIASPQVIGALRPRLLLPAGAFARPGDGELEMALAHELAHLRRRDLLFGWVPVLAARLFFFHPLAVLAAREYALAREAACDAEVLSGLGAPPHAYGRMLLTWGISGHRGLLAAALGDRRQLKRRLLMLEQTTKHRGRLRPLPALLLAFAVLASLASVRLVAAPGPDVEAGPALVTASGTAVSSGEAAADGRSVATANAEVAAANQEVARSNQAVAATHQALTVASEALRASSRVLMASSEARGGESAHSHRNTWHWDDEDGDALVFLDDDDSTGFNTSIRDHHRAEAQRRGDESLLWFERDGKEYVVRDGAVLDRVRSALEPMRQLGKQQGELGGEQGKLGGKQGALGGDQGELGAQQGKLGGKMGQLAGELATLVARRVNLEMNEGSEAELAELEAKQEELEAKMEALGDEMKALGDQQRALGEKQRALGEQQRALGEQQRALGEQQRDASEKARHEIDSLLDQALTTGKAEQVG